MRVGFIGWRGMVGSVLMGRMQSEGDFDGLDAAFFSTSSPGRPGPDVGQGAAPLLDAHDVQTLAGFDVLLTCQGGEYTQRVYPQLRAMGWSGHWIDAASALRMEPETTLVLDPLNREGIDEALSAGCRTFAGANCTVSLLLLGLQGLIQSGHVEWISTMTYQAASGAGAANLKELVAQMQALGDAGRSLLEDPGSAALALDQTVADSLSDPSFPVDHFGAPLAASAIPWIDCLVDGGQTREEWKAMAEANKLLGREPNPLPIDGLCVRIGAMRCHAQAVTIKLDADVPLDEISAILDEAHPWSGVVDNTKEATLDRLTPAAVAGTLEVPVGRLRKMNLGPQFVTAFTVGDQLLWGAAEPLRRMLEVLRSR
jgi:aspartate-semialdehyde dehydrogenase